MSTEINMPEKCMGMGCHLSVVTHGISLLEEKKNQRLSVWRTACILLMLFYGACQRGILPYPACKLLLKLVA